MRVGSHFMRTRTEHKKPVQNSKYRTGTGQYIGDFAAQPEVRKTTKLPKTHQDYWLSRLHKRSYASADGKAQIEVPDWQVRLFQAGKEGWFNLGTANKAAAAVKARDTYVYLKANGWEAALAKFKPESDAAPRFNLTVGEYLTAVKATGQLRLRTFLNYQNCFRTIVSEAFGVKGDDSKFDYRKGGNMRWLERIDDIRLQRVTPAFVSKWQQRRVAQAGNSPVAVASAKRTASSYLRCARSLFSAKKRDGEKNSLLDAVRKQLGSASLPSLLPFDGVSLFRSGSMKYSSKMNARTLIAAARNELKPKEPEVYKAFLLGLFAGMRRAEIDLAEWRMIDWVNHVIRMEETEWLHLKTDDSAGDISVDAEVIAELQELKPLSKSSFILASDRAPRNDSPRPYYRCDMIFDRLNEWLRSKGVTANKPLHELRKEIGALVATEHGIYAASRFLRHSDITTTARHYADHKSRISVGLGKLLDTKIKSAGEPSVKTA